MPTEDCVPHAEYLIKSISEQGYTLETSIADLIDNSISADAKRIEVLVDTQRSPFLLFISDDGLGMSEEELKRNLNFPSSSMEKLRDSQDLGRFGLGLKTASFAQTRCFTVISKTRTGKKYKARTWDVNQLKKGDWKIIVNTDNEINFYLNKYFELSNGFLNPFTNYTPNTIVVWNGLYKFENDINLEERSATIQKELTDTTKEYLQLIFHRFMERDNPGSLQIRLNNDKLKPFNPFPQKARNILAQHKSLLGNNLSLEGVVLPNRSIAESKGNSEWTLAHKSLMDMEGMYIYRSNRIIVYGGWNGVIKKSPRLQLARLKVEIGNGIDHLFHLNVAKSSIAIPFGERRAFMRYVSDLKKEAEKEYFNYETRAAPINKQNDTVFKKIATNHGIVLDINKEFPLLSTLLNTLNDDQKKQLKIIFRLITTSINKIKKVHEEENYIEFLKRSDIGEADFQKAINILIESGLSKENILNEVIPTLGINIQSLPVEVSALLK